MTVAELRRLLDDPDARPNGERYLGHRAGGGHDGAETPATWTAMGMLAAGLEMAREQLLENSGPPDEG